MLQVAAKLIPDTNAFLMTSDKAVVLFFRGTEPAKLVEWWSDAHVMPCPALPCPALPCPALPCPALPFTLSCACLYILTTCVYRLHAWQNNVSIEGAFDSNMWHQPQLHADHTHMRMH